jgi:hypothetical protein
VTSAAERRCKAKTKAGRPRRVRLVNAAGYCIAHDPERRDVMRELGRRSGEARRRGPAAKLPEPEREGLRSVLRERLDHETVIAAIERALAGGNESARVSAVKFLADLELYRQEDREQKRDAPEYRERLARLLADHASRAHQAGKTELAQGFEQAARELWLEAGATTTAAIEGDFDPERCRATLKGLAERGLIRPRSSPARRTSLPRRTPRSRGSRRSSPSSPSSPERELSSLPRRVHAARPGSLRRIRLLGLRGSRRAVAGCRIRLGASPLGPATLGFGGLRMKTAPLS